MDIKYKKYIIGTREPTKYCKSESLIKKKKKLIEFFTLYYIIF